MRQESRSYVQTLANKEIFVKDLRKKKENRIFKLIELPPPMNKEIENWKDRFEEAWNKEVEECQSEGERERKAYLLAKSFISQEIERAREEEREFAVKAIEKLRVPKNVIMSHYRGEEFNEFQNIVVDSILLVLKESLPTKNKKI